MGHSSVIVICALTIIGEALADCNTVVIGDTSGQPKPFLDLSLQPSPYPQPVSYPNQCLNTNPPSGLRVTACSPTDHPQVILQNTENGIFTCPSGCVVSSVQYCSYGSNQPGLPAPIVSPLPSDRGSNRNLYYRGH